MYYQSAHSIIVFKRQNAPVIRNHVHVTTATLESGGKAGLKYRAFIWVRFRQCRGYTQLLEPTKIALLHCKSWDFINICSAGIGTFTRDIL